MRRIVKSIGPVDLFGVGIPFYKLVLVRHFYRNRRTRAFVKRFRRRQLRRSARVT